MIYTSCFDNWDKFTKRTTVSIATSPKYPTDEEDQSVMPPRDLLGRWYRNEISENEYALEYYERVLRKLDITAFVTRNNEKVLLCWEKMPKFCHRHLLARYLKHQAGIEVIEL